MTKSTKISYVLIALLLLIVCVMHLATPFITVLFSYFALRKLRFGRRGKTLAVVLFLILVAALGTGAFIFVKQAYVAIPKIVSTTVPTILEQARLYGIELPFSDYAGLKAFVGESLGEQLADIGKYATEAVITIASLIIGIVVAVSLFLDARFQLEPEKQAIDDNIYASVWKEVGARFKTFYHSFDTVMGAQIVISAINTTLTSAFLLWNGFPHIPVIIVMTFLCGLLPIIGNLISNTLIVGVAFTLSPNTALWSLVFLVVLHKLEYFLNSKVIGDRIKNPMWLTLLGLIIGETLMGIPGMILAPVVLHYIKVEASKSRFN
ncbi:MAG TPA: AI-2E family transporter [Opitutaceae bacterium]|jgi:predicted PurR-regulated permease PerM|nr:AI-2E family transporter [Opitutaceae bacterium]HOD47996.1 AI-2E family transporter [Opitutaceae bacterium]HQL22465.1 AI-2E family transporter [Opitutaceae bacterium]